MKEKFFLISFLIFVSVISNYGQSNSWNGLTPLHSTRTDAEKLLGGGEKRYKYSSEYEYNVKNGKITIEYTARPCDNGWNVPIDTILSITVYTSADVGKSVKDLNLDESEFSFKTSDYGFALWINSESGLTYGFESRDYLSEKGFIPKKSDNEILRCNGFPPYAPDQYYETDYIFYYQSRSSKKENLYGALAQFDSLALTAKSNGYQGYAMIYFNPKMSLKERQKLISDINDFLFKLRKYPYNLIKIIEGGLREETQIYYYITLMDALPPAPQPSLPSPQFVKHK